MLDALARPPGAGADLRAQAWFALGRIAEQQTNLSAAVEAYGQGEAAAEDAGLRLENRISRARLNVRLGQPDQAVVLLEDAVKQSPVQGRTGDAQLELAGILLG